MKWCYIQYLHAHHCLFDRDSSVVSVFVEFEKPEVTNITVLAGQASDWLCGPSLSVERMIYGMTEFGV